MMANKVVHYYQTTLVGPNIVIQCSCGWSVVKRKDLSAIATRLAREHYADNRPARPPVDKYEEMARRLPPREFTPGAYRNWHINHTHTGEYTDSVQQGGNLRKVTPRTGKYRGLNVEGLKIK